MPPLVRLRQLLRGLGKVIAVVVAATAAGVVVGFGLGALAGGDSSTRGLADTSAIRSTTALRKSTQRATMPVQTAPKSEPQPSTATLDRGTPTTTSPATSREPGASTVFVQIVSAVLHRAGTPSGRSRNRARLSVHVRVTNRGNRPIVDVQPVLLAGARVRADPSAADVAGSLRRPVATRSTAGGTLRFETAGAVTDRLVSTRRAQLRIAGKTAPLALELGTPARPAKQSR